MRICRGTCCRRHERLGDRKLDSCTVVQSYSGESLRLCCKLACPHSAVDRRCPLPSRRHKRDMSQSFRDLFIWQRAVELATLIAELTKNFPSRQRHILADQMLRSSVSVASNIAEGAGRLSRADLRRFLGIARGSLHELATQIEIAARCQLLEESCRHTLERHIALIGTGLNRWMAKLK